MVKIFVGGLAPDVSEIDIVIQVSIYGQVITIKIVRDKVTRKSKGYAFLEMATLEGAERAVEELNGTRFKGNVLTVKIAEEAPAKPKVFKKTGPGTGFVAKRPRKI